MARTDTLTNFLADVATAIKTKKGDTTAIPAENFDTEILNLPSGDDSTLRGVIERTATNIEIPEGITNIGKYSFSYCNNLTSVSIPNTVESIDIYAFNSCTNLTNITIPSNITSIGNFAFNSCSKLNAVHISNMKSWCKIVFGNNYSNPLLSAHNLYLNQQLVTDLVIPLDVTSIKNYTFYGCTSLESVNTSNAVTSIGNSAFYGCTSLSNITFGNHVTSIANSAFMNCTSLSSVIFPSSVTNIYYNAFNNCSNLSVMDFSNHTAVPTLGGASTYVTPFTGMVSNLVVRVPNALVTEWKQKTGWSRIASKIVGV